MARTIPAAAQTEADKTSGAQFVRILEIQWPGGTQYYSTRDLTSPVTASGIVIDFPVRKLTGIAGKANAQSTMTIELADTDHSLQTQFDTSPGPQNVPVYVHLYFEGTTWATDKVTEIGGILTTPMKYDGNRSIWSITIRGFEYHFDRDIGTLLTLETFSEVNCTEAEGKIIPIVYGDPCRRVPAYVLNRPGGARLIQTLNVVPDTNMYLNKTAERAGFTTGTTIDLIVGYPNRWERITGSFSGPTSNVFNIGSPLDDNRGAVEAQGTLPGFYASGGRQYIILRASDFADGGAASRSGKVLYLQTQGGGWVTTLITYWDAQGSNIVVAEKGDLNVVTGSNWKVGSVVGEDVRWPPGTPVVEDGSWTYICNILPSQEVISVEAKGSVNTPNGDSQTAWFRYNPAWYTVNRNDTQFNTALGRDPADPGVTTVTLTYAPTQVGFETETVWVTLRGITDDNTENGTAISNPASIIENLLSNDFLGGIAASFVNSASFTAAAALVTTSMAFAILERKRLNDLVTDLAHQGMMTYWWDQGQANVVYIDNTLDIADTQLTLTPSNVKRGGFHSSEQAVHELTTTLLGRYAAATPAPELKIARSSSAAETEYGKRRDEINLWAYQAPTSVALVVEHWLKYRLQLQRVIKLTTYLVGLHLQPGDTIDIDWDDGNANAVYSNRLARVRSVRQTSAHPKANRMETIEIEAEITLWTFAIQTATPNEETCDAELTQAIGIGTGQKLYVRSDGVNSMYVVPQEYAKLEDGGQNLDDSIGMEACDPDTADQCGVINEDLPGVTLPGPDPLSSGLASSSATSGSSSSGSSSSGSSASSEACGTCKFQWNGSQWLQLAASCDPATDCECVAPTSPGTFVGEERVTNCAGGSATSASSASSSSGSSSSGSSSSGSSSSGSSSSGSSSSGSSSSGSSGSSSSQATVTCTNCLDNTGPSGWSITPSGVTNDGCADCVSTYDGVEQICDSYGSCVWTRGPQVFCGGPQDVSVSVEATKITANLAGASYEKVISNPDCLTSHVLSKISDDGGGNCTWPATITIVPIT